MKNVIKILEVEVKKAENLHSFPQDINKDERLNIDDLNRFSEEYYQLLKELKNAIEILKKQRVG